MPWYEREDFAQLLELAEDRNEMSPSYEDWRSKALSVADQYLATGRALQMVTIRPGDFLAWIAERRLPNTAANRLRYVEMMATAQLNIECRPSRKEVDHARHEPNELQADSA
jgi:hypothetical protein